jgi:predicted metal-binding protein
MITIQGKMTKDNGNEKTYEGTCPYCDHVNVVTDIIQQISVIQLNSVCVHYQSINIKEIEFNFKKVNE